MMMNVLDFPGRRQKREGEGKNLLAALDSVKKISRKDAEILAHNLGAVAAELADDRLDGARQIFERAWNKESNYWLKRKRYLRFGGEAGADPRDEGSYAANPRTWSKILKAAAELKAERTPGAPEWQQTAQIRRLLFGTQFNPATSTIPLGAEGARELLNQFSSRLAARIRKNTRLEELFAILEAAPFAHDIVTSDGTLLDSYQTALANASLVFGGKLPPEFRWGFVGKPCVTGRIDTSWAHPSIVLGVVARKFEHRVFVAPQSVGTAALEWANAELNEEPLGEGRQIFENWLQESGAQQRGGKWVLPDVPFTPVQGYGWKKQEFEQTRLVWLELRLREDGIAPMLKVDLDDEMDFIPYDSSGRLTREAVQRPKSGKEFTYWLMPECCSFSTLRWPDWISGFYKHRDGSGQTPRDNQLIGFIEDEWVSWTGDTELAGWLDDADHHELVAMLVGADPAVRFFPMIAQDDQRPVPCRADSIAGAILRNLGAPVDERIYRRLEVLADLTAKAGCAFHEQILQSYQSLLEEI